MRYRRMGKTGLKVSELCFGTMTFGSGTDQGTADCMVREALDAGINFFDTANSYGGGQSEVMLGKAIPQDRENLIIATKFFNPTGSGVNDSGMSRLHIMQALEASLKRLGTDYVDLFYIHHVDRQTPMEEMLRAFDDLARQGKVRYTGCSNFQGWRLMKALSISDLHNWTRFDCYQPQYSLVVRDIEQELIPICQTEGLGVVVWSPLGGGFLSGKYQPGQRLLSGTRSADDWAFPQNYFAANADETLQSVIEVAQETDRSPAQIALRWCLEQPAITSIIIGARTLDQFADNLKADSFRLEAEQLERLNRVSHLPDRYPESMEKNMHQRRDDAVSMPSA